MIVPQKRFNSQEDLEFFLKDQKEWMYKRTTDCIREALRSGHETAVILEAIIGEDTSLTATSIVIEIDISDWINSLTLALKWYVLQENYEKCSELRDMIEDIRVIIDNEKKLL